MRNWVLWICLFLIILFCLDHKKPSGLLIEAILDASDLASNGVIECSLNVSTVNPNAETLFLYHLKGMGSECRTPTFLFDETLKTLYFYESSFDMYDKNGALIDADACNYDYFRDKDLHYFSNFNTLQLIIEMNSMSTKRPICPCVFMNGNIEFMALDHYGRGLLSRDTFLFYEQNATIDINSRNNRLQFLQLFRQIITPNYLKRLVFSSIHTFSFYGLLAFIDPNFFKQFDQLYDVEINVDNTGDFFHASYNEWLSTMFIQMANFLTKQELINYLNSANLRIFTLKIMPSTFYGYQYPDEDFGLFKYFPRYKPIITSIKAGSDDPSSLSNRSSTSCTYRFLSQNNIMLIETLEEAAYPAPSSAVFSESLLNDCSFDETINLCMVHEYNKNRLAQQNKGIYYLDVTYAFNWIEYLGPIITFPIFSALAFLLNLLIILIIRSNKNKTEKLFEARAYHLIEMNSALNCIECLIYQFRLIGICLGVNSVYCSPIRHSRLVFYFGVINYYISEAMKSSSMMTGLLFSIQRYIEASRTQNTRLKSFSKVKIRRLFILVLVYGLIFSGPVVPNVNFNWSFIDSFDSPSIFYITVESFKYKKLETVLFFSHFVANDFVILILNLIVDSLLVHHIKTDLKIKLKNRGNLRKTDNARMSEGDKKKTKEEEKKIVSVERKANALIIVSVVIYVFCRLPELVGVFVTYFYHEITSNATCGINLICYLILNSIEYVYMLSYIFNIFLYYNLNSNFKSGFKNFFKLV